MANKYLRNIPIVVYSCACSTRQNTLKRLDAKILYSSAMFFQWLYFYPSIPLIVLPCILREIHHRSGIPGSQSYHYDQDMQGLLVCFKWYLRLVEELQHKSLAHMQTNTWDNIVLDFRQKYQLRFGEVTQLPGELWAAAIPFLTMLLFSLHSTGQWSTHNATESDLFAIFVHHQVHSVPS